VNDETSSNNESADGERSALLHNSINAAANYLSVDTNMSAAIDNVEEAPTLPSPTTNTTTITNSGVV